MSSAATIPSHFIGCDVGKQSVVTFDSATGQIRTIPNRKPDLVRFVRGLEAACFAVCEATGGYEAKLLQAFIACGRAIHRADARKVKAFIRSFGTLGKTDEIDARALARYGAERHQDLARWQAPDPVREQLQAQMAARTDLICLRQAQQNRLAAPGSAHVAASIKAVLRVVQQQIRVIDAHIVQLVRQHPQLAEHSGVLQSIQGVGAVTAHALLALMPELGRICARKAAALAGLAPHPKQSGAANAYRNTRGGRPQVKRALFMAAMVAAKHHPVLREVYQRLIENGKKPLVAITAIMRKLVVIANAKIRDKIALNQRQQVS